MKENLLLAVVPEHERRRIAPYCETVELPARTELSQADVPLEYAYFPHSGVLSSLMHVESGEAVEVGLVGREGMTGLPLVLGGDSDAYQVVVQAPVVATRIAREPFVREVMRRGHPFCDALLKFANLFIAVVAQTAACNRLHRIDQRLARWLLEMRARTDGPELPLTHEFLGLMVGAYRPSVTNALSTLEEQGIVQVGRGRVTITNAAALENAACNCYRINQERTAQTYALIRETAA